MVRVWASLSCSWFYRKSFQFFTIEYDVSCGLIICGLYYLEVSSLYGEGNGTPLQCSCLENLMDRGAWQAAVHGVAKSQTRLSNFTFTFHFQALEKEIATHSSVLAWRIPGTGEPGGLPSMGSHRVRHNWSDLAAAAAEAVSSLSTQSVECFIVNECWVLGNDFPASTDMVFILHSVNVKYYIDNLYALNHPCFPRINPTEPCVWPFKCTVEFGLLIFCQGFWYLCLSGILVYNFLFL